MMLFFLENCKNSNISKNNKHFFHDNIHLKTLKSPLYSDFFKTCCMILFRHFIEFLTLGLNNEILGFLEFLSLQFNRLIFKVQ